MAAAAAATAAASAAAAAVVVVVVQILTIFAGSVHHVLKVCSNSLEKCTVSIFRVTTGPGRC